MSIYGIDVSKYQGQIDWKAVRAEGKEFAFVRLGWAGWDGGIKLDEKAEENIKGAVAARLHAGVYVYSYCKTAEAARLAAKETISLLKNFPQLMYPIAFDIEDTSETGTPYNRYVKSDNSAIVAAYLDEIEKAGYYGMLYTYKSFAENYLDMSALKKYDLWIAHYAAKNGYAGSCGIWQYAGDSGRCGGVNGACDLNISYKDYAGIIKAAGLNGCAKAQDGGGQTEFSSLQAENKSLREQVARLEERLREIAKLAS